MNVLALVKLHPAQVVSYLNPIARLPEVEKLHIVRAGRVDFPSDKVVWHEYRSGGRLASLLWLQAEARRVLRQEAIDYVVAINPVPYGLIAFRLARQFHKPVAVSLIGSDYRYHCHAWYRAPLHAMLRRCHAITGTGVEMVETIRSWGVESEKTQILPHALDMDRFAPRTPLAEREYDAIYCGKLISRKRVDLIIRSFGRLLESHPAARLAIVGDGPLRSQLESLASAVGARRQIDFLGEQTKVEEYFNAARVMLLTSEVEGLPFVMLEAMSCGCVPICTRCGTIEDVLLHGQNGFLVDQLDWQAVAQYAGQLLQDPQQLERMSQAALQLRADYSWAAAERVWQTAFARAA